MRIAARKLRRFQVGGLPLIRIITDRLDLRNILADYFPSSGRQLVPSVEGLILLAANMTIAKDPLYELGGWVRSLDLRALGFSARTTVQLNDDFFGRILDKLFAVDRASLLTRPAVSAIDAFEVRLTRIHNDSTSVKTCGSMPGRTRTGFQLLRGHSKDHRPDLKQLVYSLSVSADGAVPIHHHVYCGNRNDDTTHIETWEALRHIHDGPDFLYVADCKLCTREQLAHIVGRDGKAITILPQNLTEVRRFKDKLRAAPKPKKILWRRPKPGDPSVLERFDLFEGSFRTIDGGYPIHWFCSSEKRERDRQSRTERIAQAEAKLNHLLPKLNRYRLKRRCDILRAATAILEHYRVADFVKLRIETQVQRLRRRMRGRPGRDGRFRYLSHYSYSLRWSHDAAALAGEARTDGVFPLLCTDPSVPPKDVLEAYKFQPRLEKRFCQLKSIHQAAPLLFKKTQRVEANMFVFFIALLIQSLLERLLRQRIAERKSAPLKLYPEDRDAPHPTTSQLLKTFDGLSTYTIVEDEGICEEYHDELNETQRAVLSLLDIDENQFWQLA